jgi:hypothetical protein
MTTVMSSCLAGAVITTFLAPATRWPLAIFASLKRPVDSTTISQPSSSHGSAAGPSLTARHLILWSFTTSISWIAQTLSLLVSRDNMTPRRLISGVRVSKMTPRFCPVFRTIGRIGSTSQLCSAWGSPRRRLDSCFPFGRKYNPRFEPHKGW